jgi:hypothetical protein
LRRFRIAFSFLAKGFTQVDWKEEESLSLFAAIAATAGFVSRTTLVPP